LLRPTTPTAKARAKEETPLAMVTHNPPLLGRLVAS
jgi:hypothetical protein